MLNRPGDFKGPSKAFVDMFAAVKLTKENDKFVLIIYIYQFLNFFPIRSLTDKVKKINSEQTL